MTNNNLTDERLSALIRVARDSLELYEMELPVIDDVMLALAELQQRRAVMLQGAEPVSNRDELPATQQQQNAQQNIPNNIPGGLIEAVNDLLNNDGSRGRYSAIGCGNAREKIELWLSQRQKWESQRDKNISAGNSPVIPDSSEDTKRLDWLDYQNKRLNEYYGTAYGWKFDANFQRNAMMLNDSNYPVMTVRQAIDQAIASAPQQEGKDGK